MEKTKINKAIYVLNKYIGFAMFGRPIAHNTNHVNANKPNLFLGNHDTGHNPSYVHLSLPTSITSNTYTVVKSNIAIERSQFIKTIQRGLMNRAGAVMLKRNDSKEKTGIQQGQHILMYEEILKESNLIVVPTGRTSRDGTIDYVEDKDIIKADGTIIKRTPNFSDQKVKQLLNKESSDFQIQYFHTTTDFIFNKMHISYARPFGKHDEFKTYVQGIGEATKITTLQILAYLHHHDKQEDIDLELAIMKVRSNNRLADYNDVSNNDLAKLAKEYYSLHPKGSVELPLYDRKGELDAVFQNSLPFQYNQIKHLEDELSQLF